jgi:hypothetical protein
MPGADHTEGKRRDGSAGTAGRNLLDKICWTKAAGQNREMGKPQMGSLGSNWVRIGFELGSNWVRIGFVFGHFGIVAEGTQPIICE